MTRVKRKGATRGPTRRKAKNTAPPTVERLLQQAQESLASVQLEDAIDYYLQALQMQPSNTNIMDALADVYLQVGDAETALTLLRQSIALAPETNGVKWMFLAQLIAGKDSLEAYKKGIEVLVKTLQESSDSVQQQSVKKTISSAFCGVAELFMTDLCFEDQAEKFCEEAVNSALAYHRSIDVLQTLASLRISQCRKNDACEVLESIYQDFVKQSLETFRQRTIIEEMNMEPESEETSDSLPSLESSVALIKLYMECSSAERPGFYDYAHDILEYVLELDDENPDLWYLMGINANSRIPCDTETAEEAFNTTKTMLESFLEQDPTMENAKCLLEDVKVALQNIGKPIPLRPQRADEDFDECQGKSIASAFQLAGSNNVHTMEEAWSDDEN